MIANTARVCSDDFQSLFASLKEVETEAQRLSSIELPSHKLADVYDRFKLWDHAFGARSGHLDRSMHAPGQVQEFVVQILQRLSQVLQEGLAEKAPYRDRLQEVLGEVRSVVNCLFDVGPALQTLEAYRTQGDDADKLQFYLGADIQHAEFRLPKAPQYLLERLAKANVKRRHRLQAIRTQYQMSRQQMSYEITAEDSVVPADLSSQAMSSTIPSKLSDISLDYSLPPSEAGSESSYPSSLGGLDTSNRRVPPPPDGFFKQIPFECPICFKLQTKIKSRPAWNKHVFADLEAYICTYESCPQSTRGFPSRDEWYRHELERHRYKTVYVCDGTCQKRFDTSTEFESHLRETHGGTLAQHQLPNIVTFCKQTIDQPMVECPFCCETENLAQKGPKCHVAEHLEELCLFGLPDLEEWNDKSWDVEHEDSDFETNETDDKRGLSKLGPHWAAILFDQLYPTVFLTSVGQNSACFEPHNPDALDQLHQEYQRLVALEFENGKFAVGFYLRPSDLRAQILCYVPWNWGPPQHCCRPLTSLKISRTGSCLQLGRQCQLGESFELWATLRFVTYERMVLFFCTFLALRSQDLARPVRDIDDHELEGEIELYTGQLFGDDYQHALRIYQDTSSKGLRLQASALSSELKRTPIWTAFITEYVTSSTWMTRTDNTIHLTDLCYHVFRSDYRPISNIGTLQFITIGDALRFVYVIEYLAVEARVK